jgi:hypothetical protein
MLWPTGQARAQPAVTNNANFHAVTAQQYRPARFTQFKMDHPSKFKMALAVS